MHALRDQVRIDENSSADNSARHGHGRAKKADLSREAAAPHRQISAILWFHLDQTVRANAVESQSHSRVSRSSHGDRQKADRFVRPSLGKTSLELVKCRRDGLEINTADTEIVAHELLLKIKLAILSGIGNA